MLIKKILFVSLLLPESVPWKLIFHCPSFISFSFSLLHESSVFVGVLLVSFEK